MHVQQHYLRFLICPLCHTHFMQVGNAIRCENNHAFDIAKEGYINLLTKKPSESMGDTKEMLLARRTFLEAGHYQILVTTMTHMLHDYLKIDSASDLPHINIVDAGCGEGYYLGQLQAALRLDVPDTQTSYMGVDIAKEAVRMAAKRYKDIHFLVSNLKEHMVFASNSMHILLNIFAPRNIEEYTRILAPGGVALVVIPAPQHLQQLRETLNLLHIEAHKQEHVIEQFTRHLSYIATSHVHNTLLLAEQEMLQIAMMTPNYWHFSDNIQREIARVGELETEIAFTCLLFRKDTVYKKVV